ncbi:trigger factor [candidate division KSB1 bacterium]|nr:trigger factor [candidate division KSB1 bacterium]
MESKVTKKGNFEKVVEVDVPEAELAPHFDSIYKKYQKNVKLQGFRKGKVPLSLIKKLYGDAMKGEAIEEVVQSVLREVRDQENLRLVAPAKLEDINYDPEKGLHFKAVCEVAPDIELKNYRGLSVEREVYEVDDQDVSDALNDVREQMAVMQPVETAAEDGHFVLADLQQVDATGVPIIGKKFKDRYFQIVTNNSNNKDFTEQLIGAKPGDKRRIELDSNDNSNSPNKENKKDYFEVRIKEIKSKQVPELDDGLAKDTGKFESLDELKTDLRSKLTKQAQVNARSRLRRSIIDEVLKKNSFDLPESMINNYLDVFVENAKKESKEPFDEEELRNHYRPTAVWNLKWELVKDKLREAENLSVSDEDKDVFISRLAEERDIEEKQVRKSLKDKRAQRQFEEDVIEDKVLNYLEVNAKIKNKKITRKDIEKAQKLAVK